MDPDVIALQEMNKFKAGTVKKLAACVPNSTPKQITERAANLINTVRSKHPNALIIVMQSLVRETGYWDLPFGTTVKQQNMNIQTEVLSLLQKGAKNLYFITSENMIGADHEGTIDGTHPNDLGTTA